MTTALQKERYNEMVRMVSDKQMMLTWRNGDTWRIVPNNAVNWYLR